MRNRRPVRRSVPWVPALCAAAGTLGSLGCGSDEARTPAATIEATDVSASECIVSLHGKGGDGAPTSVSQDVALIAPRGNDEAWGGWQWAYEDTSDYLDAVGTVSNAVDGVGCAGVVVHGFSNGASFTAKLYCRGETFGDRLVGVVIDDPVTDASTQDCTPAAGVEAVLYWTGALESAAPAGTGCGLIDFTCDGGRSLGIEAFADAAGLGVTPSPFSEHQRFDEAPEPLDWLAAADR